MDCHNLAWYFVIITTYDYLVLLSDFAAGPDPI